MNNNNEPASFSHKPLIFNIMKKIAMIFMFLFAATSLFAQKTNDQKQTDNKKTKEHVYKRTPTEVATDYTDKLVQLTGISDEQKTKIYDLKLKEVTDIRQTVAQNDMEQSVKKTKIKEIRQTFRTELKTILTPEQLEKLKATAKKAKKNKKTNKEKKVDDQSNETTNPIEDVE